MRANELMIVQRLTLVKNPVYVNHPIDWVSGVEQMSKEPSAAQKMIGDIAPKLADLTDSVLFGDVWERLNFQSVIGAWRPWLRWWR